MLGLYDCCALNKNFPLQKFRICSSLCEKICCPISLTLLCIYCGKCGHIPVAAKKQIISNKNTAIKTVSYINIYYIQGTNRIPKKLLFAGFNLFFKISSLFLWTMLSLESVSVITHRDNKTSIFFILPQNWLVPIIVAWAVLSRQQLSHN